MGDTPVNLNSQSSYRGLSMVGKLKIKQIGLQLTHT